MHIHRQTHKDTQRNTHTQIETCKTDRHIQKRQHIQNIHTIQKHTDACSNKHTPTEADRTIQTHIATYIHIQAHTDTDSRIQTQTTTDRTYRHIQKQTETYRNITAMIEQLCVLSLCFIHVCLCMCMSCSACRERFPCERVWLIVQC